MKVQIRAFAGVRELLGADVLELDLPAGTTVAALKEHLSARHPDLRKLRFTSAVNRDYADATRVLQEGDEVAFIPPISGGSGVPELFRFEFVEGPLDPRRLEAEVRTDRDGAVVTFAGVTRDHNEGQAVTDLRYEAYAEMARKVMLEIFEQAARRFRIGRARVAHRLGPVPVGEASVLVVVAAEHRGPAFDACRFLMDRLKAEVPIFKQERLAGPAADQRWIGELPEGRPPV